jgi:hypothetical protein
MLCIDAIYLANDSYIGKGKVIQGTIYYAWGTVNLCFKERGCIWGERGHLVEAHWLCGLRHLSLAYCFLGLQVCILWRAWTLLVSVVCFQV